MTLNPFTRPLSVAISAQHKFFETFVVLAKNERLSLNSQITGNWCEKKAAKITWKAAELSLCI